MNNSKEVLEEAPGAESTKPVPDLDTIEKYIEKDVSICLSFLQAIRTDKDLRRQMAIFIQGRYSNALHKPEKIDL